MNEFEIDDFPIQSNSMLGIFERKYPWEKLDRVGRGFWIPEHCAITPVRSAASNRGKKLGMKFRVMRIGERFACIRVA